MRALYLIVFGIVFGIGFQAANLSPVSAQTEFESFVAKAKYVEAIQTYEQALEASPEDDDARFRLGVAQFLRTLESVGQAWHRHGKLDGFLTNMVPVLRLVTHENPTPEPIEYRQFREILQQTLNGLQASEKTLSHIESQDVSLPLDLLKISMDWEADQLIGPHDNLLGSIQRVLGNRVPIDSASGFLVRFDLADVQWLRGYCHLLMGMCEFVLAYDQEEIWNVTARRVFSQASTPFDFLNEESQSKVTSDMNLILDAIAGIHQLRCPIREPERMAEALAHIKQTIELSRQMWKLVEAEADNDREWIPNPRQKPPFPGGEVTKDMIDGWHAFLDEAEAILNGKKLVKFWRGTNPERGVNLHHFFSKPTDFDLVLWLHGSGAQRYLQDDVPVSSPETWSRFQRIFRGEFVGFAIWFN